MISRQLVENFLERVEHSDEQDHASAGWPAIAEQWQTVGLRPGDVVLLCLANGKSLLEHFFAVMLAGGVPALMAPGTPVQRLRDVAKALGARAIGSVRPQPPELGAQQVTKIDHAVIYDCGEHAAPAAAPGEVVMMTSGTSGIASGCVFDFSSLVLNAERHAQAIGQQANDTVLINLPLYFSFALVAQAIASMVRQNRLIISGPPFHVPTYLKALERGVTISSLTPLLAASLSSAVFPQSLRVLSIGGDHLPADRVRQLLEQRPHRELYLTYGLTQAGPRVSTLAAHAEPSSRYASVGKPHPGTIVELRELADDSGLRELLISSATVMKRLIGLRESASKTASRSGTVATGDVFEQDAEGYLYFQGRMSDFIVRNGEKVCLAAVRRVAMSCPDVVRASIETSRHAYGHDFDLVLHTITGNADTCTHHLRRWLHRSEMPRSIKVVSAEPTAVAAYK